MDYAERQLSNSRIQALIKEANQAMLQLNLRRKLVAPSVAAAPQEAVELAPVKAVRPASDRPIISPASCSSRRPAST